MGNFFSANKLVRSKSYNITSIRNALYRVVSDYQTKNKLSLIQLEEIIGKGKPVIRQIMDGEFEGTLSDFVEISILCGKTPIIEFLSFEDAVRRRRQ